MRYPSLKVRCLSWANIHGENSCRRIEKRDKTLKKTNSGYDTQAKTGSDLIKKQPLIFLPNFPGKNEKKIGGAKVLSTCSDYMMTQTPGSGASTLLGTDCSIYLLFIMFIAYSSVQTNRFQNFLRHAGERKKNAWKWLII